jgi:hypothetical protein
MEDLTIPDKTNVECVHSSKLEVGDIFTTNFMGLYVVVKPQTWAREYMEANRSPHGDEKPSIMAVSVIDWNHTTFVSGNSFWRFGNKKTDLGEAQKSMQAFWKNYKLGKANAKG